MFRANQGRAATAVAIAIAWSLCVVAPSTASLRLAGGLVTDGPVAALARIGHRLYLGGDFSHIGPNTGAGVAVKAESGRLDARFPHIDGDVRAVISDGAGGFYVGGAFDHVGGSERSGLVRIRANGMVDPTFVPQSTNSASALLLAGGKLFVAGFGKFTAGGESVPPTGVIALDPNTGVVDPSFTAETDFIPYVAPSIPARPSLLGVSCPGSRQLGFHPPPAFAMAASATRLYVAGRFSRINGMERDGLAALDLRTGRIDAGFNPVGYLDAPRTSRAYGTPVLAIAGNRLFIPGSPARSSSVSRSTLLALDADSGAIDTSFNSTLQGSVNSLVVVGDTLYAGGSFSTGPSSGVGLAALDVHSGTPLTGFVPTGNEDVTALTTDGERIVAASAHYARSFSYEPIITRRLVALDARDGHRLAEFMPTFDDRVSAIAVSENRVYAGGIFNSVGGRTGTGLAAIDLRSGQLDPKFRPSGELTVSGLRSSRSRLYASGMLRLSDGKLKGLISLLPESGRPDPGFRAEIDYTRGNLVLDKERLYLPTPEANGVAAFDMVTGARDRTFRSPPLDRIETLASFGDRLYVGRSLAGDPLFDPQGPLVALNVHTGALDRRFKPLLKASRSGYRELTDLLIARDHLYAAGRFGSNRSSDQTSLVALDPRTGIRIRRFRPTHGTLRLLDAIGRHLYDERLRAIDLVTGRTRGTMDPFQYGFACACLNINRRLYVGGYFYSVMGQDQPNFAELVQE